MSDGTLCLLSEFAERGTLIELFNHYKEHHWERLKEMTTVQIRVSWVTPKMSQNFDLMYFNKIKKSHLFANNE